MSRLIDADSLVRNIKKWEKYIGNYEKEIPYNEDIYVSIMMTIEDEPTVDAVPVIRCRDCKHWLTVFDKDIAESGFCNKYSQLETTKADDYCSRAEGEKNENQSK